MNRREHKCRRNGTGLPLPSTSLDSHSTRGPNRIWLKRNGASLRPCVDEFQSMFTSVPTRCEGLALRHRVRGNFVKFRVHGPWTAAALLPLWGVGSLAARGGHRPSGRKLCLGMGRPQQAARRKAAAGCAQSKDAPMRMLNLAPFGLPNGKVKRLCRCLPIIFWVALGRCFRYPTVQRVAGILLIGRQEAGCKPAPLWPSTETFGDKR
jgi:hypothetical protein